VGIVHAADASGKGFAHGVSAVGAARWVAIVVASVAFASLHQMDQAPIILLLSLGWVMCMSGREICGRDYFACGVQQHEYIDVFGGGK